jgi:hypothetical protein
MCLSSFIGDILSKCAALSPLSWRKWLVRRSRRANERASEMIRAGPIAWPHRAAPSRPISFRVSCWSGGARQGQRSPP